MAEGSQLMVELIREELHLSRESILTDFRAEISILHTELRQEIEAIFSETTSFKVCNMMMGEEINRLRQDHVQVIAEQAEIAHSLTDAQDPI